MNYDCFVFSHLSSISLSTKYNINRYTPRKPSITMVNISVLVIGVFISILFTTTTNPIEHRALKIKMIMFNIFFH